MANGNETKLNKSLEGLEITAIQLAALCILTGELLAMAEKAYNETGSRASANFLKYIQTLDAGAQDTFVSLEMALGMSAPYKRNTKC